MLMVLGAGVLTDSLDVHLQPTTDRLQRHTLRQQLMQGEVAGASVAARLPSLSAARSPSGGGSSSAGGVAGAPDAPRTGGGAAVSARISAAGASGQEASAALLLLMVFTQRLGRQPDISRNWPRVGNLSWPPTIRLIARVSGECSRPPVL